MSGDPKVVAALAVAVLALPPVVNAIMEKAAEQAEVDWLREGDLEVRLEPGEGPLPGGSGEGEGPAPPPPVPPPCQRGVRGPPPETVAGPASLNAAGMLQYESLPGDIAVAFQVEGRDVTGSPTFRFTIDGEEAWSEGGTRVSEPVVEAQGFPGPLPGTVYALSWDLRNTLHGGFGFAIAAQHCEVPR